MGGNLYWVGARKSDIEDASGIYSGSITLFGDNRNNNRSFSHKYKKRINHNISTPEQHNFFVQEIEDILKIDSDAFFMFYNPRSAYSLGKLVSDRTVCLNDKYILDLLSNKIYSRIWLSNYVPVLGSITLLGGDCLYSNISSRFPDHDAFVIQLNSSSGGFGTYLMNAKAEGQVMRHVEKQQLFLVSPYHKNSIPLNIHAIIYETDILLLPPSIQIINENNNRLLYRGADYIAYKDISESIKNKIQSYSYELCKQLQRVGYKGVCGIDYIAKDEEVYFLEMNARFQASSFLLNLSLRDNNKPSLNELCIESFYRKKGSVDVEINKLLYSNYAYIFNGYSHYQYIIKEIAASDEVVRICLDGFESTQHFDEDAFLYRAIFNTNITSINCDNGISLHCNIKEPDSADNFYHMTESSILKLKVRLLNQGLFFTDTAKQYFDTHKPFKKGVFNSVNISLFNSLKINCPYDIKLTSISPFCVDYDNKLGLHLKYYDTVTSKLNVELEDILYNSSTATGVPFKAIANLAFDRLRIHHVSTCYFKENNRACKFCDLPVKQTYFTMNDIIEVIDKYLLNVSFRHFLIGGGSAKPEEGWEHIKQIVVHMRMQCNKPIYLMCLPPRDLTLLNEIYDAGVSEIAFNIEVFDRKLAKKIMPGKGAIPLTQYYNALEAAVALWGNSGNVRSVLIAGLESTQSFLNGIETICKIGVAPIISVFRPLPNTQMVNMTPPSNEYLYKLYDIIMAICDKYKLRPGPECPDCQNNTLSLPYKELADYLKLE